MKNLIPVLGIVVLTMLVSLPTWAGGDSVGAGGVIWACRSEGPGQTLYSGILTDLHEAREQHRWTLIQDSEPDPLQIYERRKTWLQQEFPDLFATLKSRFEYVEQHRQLVRAELASTKDFNNVLSPVAEDCPKGKWEAVNIANFREEDQQVLISEKLWNTPLIPSLDKAALLFHEAIYYWMRTYYGATNSDKSRKLTGVLFSTLKTSEIKKIITDILGNYPHHPNEKYICVIKNSLSNHAYVSFGQDLDETSFNTEQRCQADPEPKWCRPASLECMELGEVGNKNRCVARNLSTGRIFMGRGRNVLEAQFNAHTSCFIGSQESGKAVDCPDFMLMECK